MYRELLSPLTLTALAAWAAVWLMEGLGVRGEAPWQVWTVRVALLGYLAALLTSVLLDSRLPRVADLALATIMAALALVATSVNPFGAAPILLVVAAAVFAANLEAKWLAPVLLLLNLGHLALLLQTRNWGTALPMILAYASFQVFAVLLMRYARRTEAMAMDLRRVNAELLAARSLLEESAREGERLRLSRELHDVAGHKLTALKLNLRQLERGAAVIPAATLALVDELLADLRGVVRQLRMHVGVDPSAAIAELAAALPQPQVALALSPSCRADSVAGAEALVRCAQEALTNAARHSRARQVRVELQPDGDTVCLTIADDGAGCAGFRPGLGLTGMGERLAEVGGGMSVETAPGAGWRLQAWVPAGTAGTPS
jgi:signal transduction histidine kinase